MSNQVSFFGNLVNFFYSLYEFFFFPKLQQKYPCKLAVILESIDKLIWSNFGFHFVSQGWWISRFFLR